MTGTVIVTGGGGVIGRAICARLADSGYHPVAADLESSVPEGVEKFPYAFVGMDVRSRASVLEGVAAVVSEGERITGVVNCAGVLRDSFVGELDEASLDLMFQVNVAGMARVVEATVDHLESGASIVNIGSLTGHFGRFEGASVYGATKAGVAAYTRYLASELAPRGIRVNNVAPGVIRAPMSPSMARVSGGEEASSAHAMLKRIGEPEEVAEVVEFFISPRSSYVTAQTLLVDGGVVAW